MKLPTFALLVTATLAACGGDDPVDAAGTYSIALTNRENGCNLGTWTVGDTAQNVGAVITQDGEQVSADVQGAARVGLDLWLGAHVFTGVIEGDELELSIAGTRAGSMNACAYTYDAVLDATISGDVLRGEVRYQARTNGSPDCGALTGCASRQELNGTRPPT